MRGLMITGTDTSVGKTEMACLILREAREAGLRVGAYKPACSGAERRDGVAVWEDVERLRQSAELTAPGDLERVCPLRFAAPLAPPVAAALEGRQIGRSVLRSGLLAWRGRCDLLVVEGAGGLLCPLTETETFADFAAWTGLPLIVVARRGLGTINHTLLTLEAARSRGLSVAGVILNDADRAGDSLAARTNPAELQKRMDCPLLGCLDHGSQSLCLPDGRSLTRMAWLELARPVEDHFPRDS